MKTCPAPCWPIVFYEPIWPEGISVKLFCNQASGFWGEDVQSFPFQKVNWQTEFYLESFFILRTCKEVKLRNISVKFGWKFRAMSSEGNYWQWMTNNEQNGQLTVTHQNSSLLSILCSGKLKCIPFQRHP